MSKFAAYIVGLVIFAGGAAFALDLAGVPGTWIVAAAPYWM